MPWPPFGPLICALLVSSTLPIENVRAVSIQFHGIKGALSNSPRRLVTRAPGGLTLNNTADLSYYADIVLGNQTFQVLIDTGSSDLWVAGVVGQSNDTGLNASINYAANSVSGPIKQAPLSFADHLVPDQAFLEIPPDNKNPAGVGILGLGPSSGSFISKKVGTLPGAPVLDRIFHQNRTTPNFFTVLLGRDKDPTDAFSGSITVGELLPEYQGIVNEPHLAITQVPDEKSDDQHLQILLDQDGIIGPDGKTISLVSVVEQTRDKRQATVVLDCGFTLPQLPRSAVDAIYSRFHGAEYTQIAGVGGAWVLPCVQEVNVTFKFAGKLYPMHPLDMSMEFSTIGLQDLLTSDGERACIGTFQPFTYDRGLSPNYDMVLGMAFMRNVYSLFDYGDFIEGSTALEDPYIQLLSITNMTEAHQDFVTVRLGGIDTTGTRGLRDSTSKSGPGRTLYYIIAAVAVVAVLVAVAIFFILRYRRRRRY
ncbi:unnamed protein product [Cyclocybe aegerita]|uniref:Peptidase A1 domain-containing protein n=1 Tax=Cyclocybe aegerita TaxID=1973307 RepID=A0A8S0WQJ4_CYCAE|nr:unnamed protein product [Cyclocybe aegerita]